jgi:ribosome-associated heat shock protein Hsp15
MPEGRQRLDKWLWYARLARTRTLAQKLAVSGSIRINRDRTDSASHPVKIGDVLTIALPGGVRVLKIVAAGERRGPAAEARLLYDDLTPQQPPSPERIPSAGGSRPTKRDRRQIDEFLAAGNIDQDFSPDEE